MPYPLNITPPLPTTYLGVMSGTSMDAINAAAVTFSDHSFTLLGTHSEPFPLDLRQALLDLCQPGEDEINRLGQLDRQVGFLFANTCNNLLSTLGLAKEKIGAIGSHGQTIRHQPTFLHPFSLQIGDPNIIAEVTGITTVADFRRRDMVYGGQGAPLTPAFHRFAFHSTSSDRIVLNIGGIANLTFLPAESTGMISGFDCGPGNILLDSWAKRHLNQPFDRDGAWARQGNVNCSFLNELLGDAYFQLPPPKSTGREYFNLHWLETKLKDRKISPENVQSTLSELTACSIMDAINRVSKTDSEILLCGGGTYNKDLVTRLSSKKGKHKLFSTQDLGVNPTWVEAIAFAWLAKQTLSKLPSNLPEVTGAGSQVILGGMYIP